MQVARAAPAPAGESYRAAESQRSSRRLDSRRLDSRRLYLPTIVIAGLAAWLCYRGWTPLAGLAVLDFCYAVFYALLVIPLEDNPSSGRGTA